MSKDRPNEKFTRSWSLITVGCALLLFAAGLVYWGLHNFPGSDGFTDPRKIERAPRWDPAQSPSPPAAGSTEQPADDSSVKQTPSTRRPKVKRSRSRGFYNDLDLRYLDEKRRNRANPTPSVSPTSGASPPSLTPAASPSPAVASASPVATATITRPAIIPSPEKSPPIVQPSATPTKSPTPTVAPSPSPSPAVKRPPAIRRFFSWVGRGIKRLFGRSKKAGPNTPPQISVTSSTSSINLECPPNTPTLVSCPLAKEVTLFASAIDPDHRELLYTWSVTGGRLSGDGAKVIWDLNGVAAGTYNATVEVEDGRKQKADRTLTVTVATCPGCEVRFPPSCPGILVSSPESVDRNQRIGFSALLSDYFRATTFNWSLNVGRIISGQGTPTLTVDASDFAGQQVTATVAIGGIDPPCSSTGTSTTRVHPLISPLTGLMSGFVTTEGALLPRATVTAILRGDGRTFTAITDDYGRFVFRNLPLGTYDVRVEARGFKEVTQSGIAVNGGESTVLPIDLGVQVITEWVTVSASFPENKPTPERSPEPTPPVYKKIAKEADEISATYPDKFLRGKNSSVTVHLKRIAREVFVRETVDATKGTIELVNKPDALPGAQLDTITPADNTGLYETWVSMRLTGKGLLIPPEQQDQLKLYSKADASPKDDQRLEWHWDVRPEPGFEGQAELKFEMFVTWVSKDPKVKNEEARRVWNVTKPVEIGLPSWLVYGATYGGSPLTFGLGAGIINKGRKRRRTTSAAPAEDDEGADEVTSAVYAPQSVRPGDAFQVQVFLYLNDELIDSPEQIAQRSDPASELREKSTLSRKIASGTELTFRLSIPGVEIENPVRTGIWEDKLLRVRFTVSVPRKMKPVKLPVTVFITAESVPIGDLSFIIEVTKGEVASRDPSEGFTVRVRAYKYAFISYTRTDRPRVLTCAQFLRISKINFFQDLLNLEPGDEFEKVIVREINKSDVFLLFWSEAASKSKWVRKEIKYAVKRQAGNHGAPPKIIPVIIPPRAKPPRLLRSLHFDDELTYFTESAEAEQSKNKTEN